MPLLASIATLFDQPLSALDLAIRLEMEEELRRLHREVGATFFYVTHDQREALAISDRIAILNSGRIEQLGTPSEIYRRPSSPFAARFVGGANVIPVEIAPQGEAQISISIGVHRLALPSSGLDGGAAWLVLRPEAIRLSATPGSNGCALEGRVQDFAYRGSAHAYRVEVPGLPEPLKVEVAAEGISPFPVGSIVWIGWEASSNLFLPRTR